MKASTLLLTGALSTTFAASAFAAPLQPIYHQEWMQQKQIVKGYDRGDLLLETKVSLGEAVALIARGAGETVEQSSGYWAEGYLNWAFAKGAITKEEQANGRVFPTAARLIEISKSLHMDLKLSGDAPVTRGSFLQALGDGLTEHITIAHTNDVHGHIQENTKDKEFGYAKIATLVNDWRKENSNFLLMDAGDTFQGTIYTNQFKGETVLPILNSLGYAAMAAGNHEFDYGYEQLLNLRDQLKYPMINANVYKADGANLLVPTYTAKVGDQTIAFIGFVTEDTPIVTHPNNVIGLTFKDPVEIAKKLVPELQAQADHVIILSHIGVEKDREIAKNVPGIDLIIGGHSHTPLRTPEVVNGTHIVQDWEYGKSLGRVDMYYYDKELVGFSGGLVEYDENVKADPAIDKLVQEVVQKVEKSMNVTVGKTNVDLQGERPQVRAVETNLGNFIADAIIAKTKTIQGHTADIALVNGGGIRASKKAGDITKKDLYSILPFPNTLTIVEATGADIRAALEVSVKGVEKTDDLPGSFLQIGGMSFEYDITKPAGQRVLDVKIGGKPLDLTKTYTVATNDFITSGGDGYSMLKKDQVLNTGYTFYDVVEEYLEQHKEINPQVENRIVVKK
ncbi:multifunctional 2',3'-cyclic-nucleotide 2'-phosphodiesterase/5'-nucleotidase/3'-nucleotidase [Paenibacillus selenitireducens]|uniref:Multifunctional 2',3'-cyclic-nucleotide 2'-phosphodiesterase/5'-nucleotidase/3'-nucleotidase n=1 Tax=Paenibacillus selenitireducens TaxID=1324314 RepID=A0A1T2X6E0_9BACL|nr:bifunctional UDP-sugar hydrolase/5'-nucleotidase [Paenibacillus selenitireducens]OPA75375.1 multifunctional 2',3'-cyclic-nucleotide 2'-phosphodiesterase/5'-nucleotidase/3'-nucleotidase [Paenibacillus selenitireducens]